MKCNATEHYKTSTQNHIIIQQELDAEAEIRSNNDFLQDSTTPIQTNLDMGQENIPQVQDTVDLKSMYNSLIEQLEKLGIKHEGLNMKQVMEIIDAEIIDLSGETPPPQVEPMEVDKLSFDGQPDDNLLPAPTVPKQPEHALTPPGVHTPQQESPEKSFQTGTTPVESIQSKTPPSWDEDFPPPPPLEEPHKENNQSEINLPLKIKATELVSPNENPFDKLNFNTPTISDTIISLATENISSACQKVKWMNGGKNNYTNLELYVPKIAKNHTSQSINTIIHFPFEGRNSWFPTTQSDITEAYQTEDYKYVFNNCYVLTIDHNSWSHESDRKLDERMSEELYETIAKGISQHFDKNRTIYIGYSSGAAKIADILINTKFTENFANVILGAAYLKKTTDLGMWSDEINEKLSKFSNPPHKHPCKITMVRGENDETKEHDLVAQALRESTTKVENWQQDGINRNDFVNMFLWGTFKCKASVSEHFMKIEGGN